jgi:hypothetical protein
LLLFTLVAALSTVLGAKRGGGLGRGHPPVLSWRRTLSRLSPPGWRWPDVACSVAALLP